MSTPKNTIKVKDSVTFTLNETDLTEMQVGEFFDTPKRDVPHSNGLKWWIHYYPAGEIHDSENHLSVYLNVNKAVFATFSFKVNESSLKVSLASDFPKAMGMGWDTYASNNELRPLFVDGKVSITCEVEFAVSVHFALPKPCFAQFCDHLSTDFEIVVDNNRLQVHKSVLSLMSPVFHAMLSHDTAESRRGEVEITDFDFDTIKIAIDHCYGRVSGVASVETVINILRFADKYDIKAVTICVLEKMPQFLTAETFPALLRYADDFFKDDLFDECCEFFKKHQKDIVKMEKFATLDLLLVERLLKQAFELKTQFDVLRYAHTNGITFILDLLEPPILESLSMSTFCDIVSYAWDCSRYESKKVCVKFFHENFTEICKMKSFINLGPGTVYGVMSLRMDFLNYR